MRNFIKSFLEVEVEYVYCPSLVIDAEHFMEKFKRLERQDLPCLKLCWLSSISLFLSMCSVIKSTMIDSRILHTTDVRLIGLKFPGFSLLPLLNNGGTFANFQPLAAFRWSTDNLYILYKWGASSFSSSFITPGRKPSGPGALNLQSFLILNLISLTVNTILYKGWHPCTLLGVVVLYWGLA